MTRNAQKDHTSSSRVKLFLTLKLIEKGSSQYDRRRVHVVCIEITFFYKVKKDESILTRSDVFNNAELIWRF